jgi:hypothetical protein
MEADADRGVPLRVGFEESNDDEARPPVAQEAEEDDVEEGPASSPKRSALKGKGDGSRRGKDTGDDDNDDAAEPLEDRKSEKKSVRITEGLIPPEMKAKLGKRHQNHRNRRWSHMTKIARMDSKHAIGLLEGWIPEDILECYKKFVHNQEEQLDSEALHENRYSRLNRECMRTFERAGGWKAAPNVTTVGIRIIGITNLDGLEGTFAVEGVIDVRWYVISGGGGLHYCRE